MTTFADLNLIEPLERAIEREGYRTPTPIQAAAIPLLLAERDVLGCAQTGTGKTAAFALPVLQHLTRRPRGPGPRVIRALVLTPTRELAAQIDESFAAYGRYLDLRHLVIFGGVNQNPQVASFRRGVDILVATPGRLLDLEGQGHLSLADVEFFVLDEADRMLDMGFIHDIRRVLRLLPTRRQNLLFSATMPGPIVELASAFLHDPVQVSVTPTATTVEEIEQRVMFVERADKRRLLADLLRRPEVERALVFTRTKHGANRVVKQLTRDGIAAAAIHGNKSQNARNKAMDGFRAGEIPFLVATDIAARGIDVYGISHVINFDLPNESETYVHRIGRTGRAGASGVAISFCDPTEGEYLRAIEKLIGLEIEVDRDHDYHCDAAIPAPLPPPRERPGRSGGQRGRRRGRRDGDRRAPSRGADGDRRERPSDGALQSRPGAPAAGDGSASAPGRRRRRSRPSRSRLP